MIAPICVGCQRSDLAADEEKVPSADHPSARRSAHSRTRTSFQTPSRRRAIPSSRRTCPAIAHQLAAQSTPNKAHLPRFVPNDLGLGVEKRLDLQQRSGPLVDIKAPRFAQHQPGNANQDQRRPSPRKEEANVPLPTPRLNLLQALDQMRQPVALLLLDQLDDRPLVPGMIRANFLRLAVRRRRTVGSGKNGGRSVARGKEGGGRDGASGTWSGEDCGAREEGMEVCEASFEGEVREGGDVKDLFSRRSAREERRRGNVLGTAARPISRWRASGR